MNFQGDTVKQDRLKFSFIRNNQVHFVASELKVTNPLQKKKKGEGVNAVFMKDTSLIARNTKVFL